MINIFHEIEKERDRQDQQWGGPEHDDGHIFTDWFQYITDQMHKGFHDYIKKMVLLSDTSENVMRERFIKIAALAVAGIESIDRLKKQTEKNQENDRTLHR